MVFKTFFKLMARARMLLKISILFFEYFLYENVVSMQAMFNFLEKFGFRDGRPGPVPKMLQEEVAPPEWAREHLQAAKKAEQNSKDSNDRISGEKLLKGEDVIQLKEDAQNEEKVKSEERSVRLDNQKAEGATDGRPDSDMY